MSVVVPAYNAGGTIREALASVLNQGYEPIEIIVVDDGSSDDTAIIVESLGDPVRLLRIRHQGPSGARNAALRVARGDLIAFLDADDLWLAGKLERQVALMRAHPDIDVTSCGVRIGDQYGEVRGAYPQSAAEDVTEALLLHPASITAQSSIVARRRAIERTGEYDPALTVAEDLDFLLRLSLTARFAAVDEPLVVYRPTATSASADIENLAQYTLRALRKFFAMPGAGPYLRLRRRSCGSYAIVFSGMHYQAGDRRRAVWWGLRAILWDPRNLAALVAFPARRLRRYVAARAAS